MRAGTGKIRMKIGDWIRCKGFVIAKVERTGFTVLVNHRTYKVRDLREARRVGVKYQMNPNVRQLDLDFRTN